MADGAAQQHFGFRQLAETSGLRPGEISVDLFAGGGGASLAIERAIGRPVDIAINHDAWAVGMHAANHPFTQHKREDVWIADPQREANGRPIGWLHASPDCTHFSQARGGQPRSRKTRSLSWVVIKWAGSLAKIERAPRIISLENVKQIRQWCPLIARRCKKTGRVMKMDGSIAVPGERVPIENQQLIPDRKRLGQTWERFLSILRKLGYAVEHKTLVASDFGAGTSRDRLFLIARRDGQAIRWPAPTHGKAAGLKPVVRAADCIDFSIPCPSIFSRKKALADATHRRIAKGIKRYVIDAAAPFIIPITHHGSDRTNSTTEPLPTITTAHRGEFAVAVPTLIQAAHGEGKPGAAQRRGDGTQNLEAPLGTILAGGGVFATCAATLIQTGYGEREGQAPRALDLTEPLGVVVAGGVKHAIAAPTLVKFRGTSDGRSVEDPMPTITSGAGAARPAGAAHAMGIAAVYLEQANTGLVGHDAREPVSTIVAKGCTQRVVTAHLTAMAQNSGAIAPTEPLPTVLAGATRFGVIECTLSKEHEDGALRVAAFLMRYYGEGGQHGDLANPAHTITTKDRLALVTVTIQGTPYVIVDIGLRMLRREELFRAQGFPPDYIINRTADGRVLSISQSVRMCGNSVSPPPMQALVAANNECFDKPLQRAA